MDKHQTDRTQQHSHPPSNKIKTQNTEKAQPTTPPHNLHTRHNMGQLHAFLSTRQKNHQPIQKHMSKLPSKAKTRLRCAVGAPRTSDYRPAQYDTVHPSPFLPS